MANRSKAMLIFSVDGLTGVPDAIEAVYHKAQIQKCVIHKIPNTSWFVSYKDIKPLMADHDLPFLVFRHAEAARAPDGSESFRLHGGEQTVADQAFEQWGRAGWC